MGSTATRNPVGNAPCRAPWRGPRDGHDKILPSHPPRAPPWPSCRTEPRTLITPQGGMAR